MIYNYEQLTAKSLPPDINMPPGLAADVKYVFSVTYTDPDAMELDGLAKVTSDVVLREGKNLAAYPPVQGDLGLREFIAHELENKRGAKVSVDNIFLSSGAGGACQVFVDAFIDDGDYILMDQFCYHGSLNMFLKKGAQIIHSEMDEFGLIPEKVEENIKILIDQGTKPKMIYTISVYHNPTGITLSYERRRHLIEISKNYGVPILENESYADFRIDGPDLPQSMIGMDHDGGVMHISAFTKLMGCGLRLGFGVFPEQARPPLEIIKYGVSPSHLTSMVVHEYLKTHKTQYVSNVEKSLQLKRDAMLQSLGEYFPPSCSWSEPNGGMMIWVNLPEGTDTWNALDRAVERGVKYNPGPIFRSDREARNQLRLTFSHNSPEEIKEGIAILADVFEKEGFFNE